jgi:hypothetical protein
MMSRKALEAIGQMKPSQVGLINGRLLLHEPTLLHRSLSIDGTGDGRL